MTKSLYTRQKMLEVAGAAGVVTLFGKPTFGADQSYVARVLAKQPVAYWRLNERSGSVAHDATNHGHDGTFKNGVVLGQPGAVDGESNFAIALNGTGAYVEIPDSAVFSQPTSRQGLTVEVWMRPDALIFPASQKYIHWLGKGERDAYEWGFRFYSKDSPTRPNRISAYIWNATSPPHTQNEGTGAYFQDEIEQGKWIYVVACFDPGDENNPNAGVSIYKDGVLRGDPAKSPGARYATYHIEPTHGSAPVRLGTRDGGSFLTGALDDVAIYPRVLSEAEIMDNYRGAQQ
jgi:hypothetical protein